MSAHTPGPWVQGTSYGDVHVFQRLDGAFAGQHICECYATIGRSEAESAANARLISAAPDLLEALSDLLEKFGCGTAIELDCELCTAARAAINKATKP